MSGKGTALGVIGAGGVFLWAGVKGYSVTQVIQDLVSGKAPFAPVASLAFNVVAPAQESALHPGTGSAGTLGGSGAVSSPSALQAYAFSLFPSYGWGADQQSDLVKLWNQESGWRWNASNRSSGAYGIPQSLPASKMASAGADWKTNPQTQIRWGLQYIHDRYVNPAGAWAHEQANNWY